jgi:hypothetical protein
MKLLDSVAFNAILYRITGGCPMNTKDEKGRWIIPESSGLPAIVLMDLISRGTVCGYEVHDDCLQEMTGVELLAFKEVAWVDGWDFEPSLRCWILGDRVLYGMYGWPEQVVGKIFGLVNQRGANAHNVEIPVTAIEFQTFFILGARWKNEDDCAHNQGREVA